MIRRNHIEKVTRIDQQIHRYQPKDNFKQSATKKQFKADSENLAQQTFRVMSSNKKYHQYKGWKQQNKTKNNEVQRKETMKITQHLSQFQTNQNQCQNSLKRNYDIETEQKEFDFNNLRMYDQAESGKQNTIENLRRKRFSQHHYRQLEPVNSEVRQNLQIQKQQANQLQRTKNDKQTFSPLKRNQNYTSTQKYQQSIYPSSNKYYRPLFDNTLQNKSINRWQRPEVQSSSKAPGKIAYYENSIKSRKEDSFRSMAVGIFQAQKSKKYVLQEKNNELKKLPLTKIQKQGQQVSEKLKKISQFNDQINQRIKNIITCFQSLKGKF